MMQGGVSVDVSARDLTGGTFDQVRAKIKSVGDETDKAASVMGQASQVADTFKGAVAAIWTSEAVAKFVEFNARVIEQTAGFHNLALAANLSVEEFQALRLAGMQAGVSQDQLQTALARFNNTLGAAEQGSRQQIDALNQLGVKILDVNGKIRPTSDLLTEASRALLQMQDGALRTRLEIELFGRSGAVLTPLLQQMAQGADTLAEKFKAAGLIAGPELSEKMHQLEVQSEMTTAKLSILWAQLGAPIEAAGLSWVARQFQEIANSVALINTHRSVFDQIMEVINVIGGGLGGSIASQSAQERALRGIAEAEQKVVAAEKDLAAVKANKKQGFFGQKLDPAPYEQAVKDAQQQLAAAQAIYLKWQAMQPKDSSATGGAGASGGGGAFRTAGASNPIAKGSDRIGNQVEKLKEKLDAAAAAYQRFSEAFARGPVSPELERQIALQQKIADGQAQMTKLAHGDPRLDQMKEMVAEIDTLNDKTEYMKVLQKDADQINRQYGDGQRQLIKTMDELDALLARHLITQQQYVVIAREASLAADEQRLKFEGVQGGLTGLVAGFEAAALATQKQGVEFQIGQSIFRQFTTSTSQLFTQWAQKGKVDMASWLQSWAQMLEQASAQLITSALFKFLTGASPGGNGAGFGGGLMGSVGNWLSGLFGGGLSGTAADTANPASSWFGFGEGGFGFASGGRPPTGQPSLVGEEGPELFTPDTAGTVTPTDKLAGMVADQVGGGDIHVHLNVQTGVSQTVRAEMMNLLPTLTEHISTSILSKRARGGRYRDTFK